MAVKKLFILTLCTVVFGTSSLLYGQEPLANEGKQGLYVRSLYQVLRLEPDQVDLATAALIISERWSDLVHGRRHLQELDDMAYEIRERIEQRGINAQYKVIEIINDYLFDELGYKAVAEATNPDDLFLHSVMENKQGYCLSLSVLYLSLGERLGLPLHGVVVPGHFFVRYDNGSVCFNIETTSKGHYADDDHYLKTFNVPQDSDTLYMQNLDKMKTIGCFLNNLGNVYEDINNTQTAQETLETAVEINPTLSESHTNLGNVYLKQNKVQDAIYEYHTAIDINPEDAKAHSNLANAYSRKDWLNDAIGEYNRAIKLDPNFADAYKNLANVCRRKQLYAKAISNLKQAILLQPQDANCYAQLGNVYSEMESYEMAVSQFKKALKIDPCSVLAYCGLADCYSKMEMDDKAIDEYKKAIKINPDMAPALTNLANVYFKQKDYKKAIEYYRKAERLDPANALIYHNLGAAYSNRDMYEQSVAEYSKAVQLDPEMADAHKGLGIGHYKLENYELALKHLKIAQKLGQDVPEDLLTAVERKL